MIKYIVHNGWRWNPFIKRAEYLNAREVRMEYGLDPDECLHVDDRSGKEWFLKYFPNAKHIYPKDRMRRNNPEGIDWYSLRMTADITAKRLAILSNLSYDQYKNIELGRTIPTMFVRQRILLVLHDLIESKL